MVTGNLLGIAALASKKHSKGCSVCKSAYSPLNYFSLFFFFKEKQCCRVDLLIKMHLSDSQWLLIFYHKWIGAWKTLSFCACCNCRLKICTLKNISKQNKCFFFSEFEVPSIFFIPLIAIQGPVFVQRVPDATVAAAIKPPVCWWNKKLLFFSSSLEVIEIWKLSHFVEIIPYLNPDSRPCVLVVLLSFSSVLSYYDNDQTLTFLCGDLILLHNAAWSRQRAGTQESLEDCNVLSTGRSSNLREDEGITGHGNNAATQSPSFCLYAALVCSTEVTEQTQL